MHISDYGLEGPAQRFILERVDLLLARLESLGRQVRDTLSRIIGVSVAEAVAEMIRGVTRYLPGRRTARPRIYDEYAFDDGYDPFADEVDPFDGQAADRRAVTVKPTSTGRCRRFLATMATFLIRSAWRIKHLRWPVHGVLIAGASILLRASDEDASSPDQPSEISTPGSRST